MKSYISYIILLALSVLIITGCSTMRAEDYSVRSLAEAQQAVAYQDNGQYEEAISNYKELIAANSRHFKSVLYQHEIMLNTEALGDTRLIVDEIRNTADLLIKARDEQFEGATQEAIQKERIALDDFVINKTYIFYKLSYFYLKYYLQMSSEYKSSLYFSLYSLYRSNINDILEIYQTRFNENIESCGILFYQGEFAMVDDFLAESVHVERDAKTAAEKYTKLLDKCDDETQFEPGEYPEVYVRAAQGAYYSYDVLSHRTSDECPEIPNTTEEISKMPETQAYPEYPIAECRQNFLNAAQRYYDILEKYPEYRINSYKYFSPVGRHFIYIDKPLYYIGEVYYKHNYFDKALQVFLSIIHKLPQSRDVDFARNSNHDVMGSVKYIIWSYIKTNRFDEMSAFIMGLANNSDFLSIDQVSSSIKFIIESYQKINRSDELPEFIRKVLSNNAFITSKESLNPEFIVKVLECGISFKEIIHYLTNTEDAIKLAIDILHFYQDAERYEDQLKFIAEIKSDSAFMSNDSPAMKSFKHRLEWYEKTDSELLEDK